MESKRRNANLYENTIKVLEKHASSTYKAESIVKEALERLKKDHVVIMTGKAGDGKTTTSYQIMSKLSDDYTPAIIDQPHQWDKVVNSDKNTAIFLNDVLGKTCLDHTLMENWRNIFPSVLSSAQNGKDFVIVGLRQDILNEVREIYPDQQLFNKKYEINLSSNDHETTGHELEDPEPKGEYLANSVMLVKEITGYNTLGKRSPTFHK